MKKRETWSEERNFGVNRCMTWWIEFRIRFYTVIALKSPLASAFSFLFPLQFFKLLRFDFSINIYKMLLFHFKIHVCIFSLTFEMKEKNVKWWWKTPCELSTCEWKKKNEKKIQNVKFRLCWCVNRDRDINKMIRCWD